MTGRNCRASGRLGNFAVESIRGISVSRGSIESGGLVVVVAAPAYIVLWLGGRRGIGRAGGGRPPHPNNTPHSNVEMKWFSVLSAQINFIFQATTRISKLAV